MQLYFSALFSAVFSFIFLSHPCPLFVHSFLSLHPFYILLLKKVMESGTENSPKHQLLCIGLELNYFFFKNRTTAHSSLLGPRGTYHFVG